MITTFTRPSRNRIAGIAPLFAAMAACACAAPVTVNNPGFEDPVIANGTFATTSAPAGWSTYGDINFINRVIGVLNPATTTLYSVPAPDGANVGVVFLLDAGPAVESGFSQTLAATLHTNTLYTLQVDIGNIVNDPNPPHSSFNFSGFPGYRVDLLAGGTVIASDNNTLLPDEGKFLTSTVMFSVGGSHLLAGQQLGIRLVNLDGAAGIEVNFDNVRLDASPAPIPEPASFGFCAAAAALGLTGMIRRRGSRPAA